VLRRRRQIFQKWIGQLDGTKLEVLDVGGRIQPYRPLFDRRLRRYVAIDLRKTPVVDVVSRGEHIPFAGETFDVVICTQVLEYVRNPLDVVSEIHRVLKPGGVLLVSVPAIAIRDSDEEYYRIFPFALRGLLQSFADLEIVPEGGSVVGLFRMLNSALDMFARYPGARRVFRWTLCPIINVGGELLNWLARSKNDQLSNNYAAWARK